MAPGGPDQLERMDLDHPEREKLKPVSRRNRRRYRKRVTQDEAEKEGGMQDVSQKLDRALDEIVAQRRQPANTDPVDEQPAPTAEAQGLLLAAEVEKAEREEAMTAEEIALARTAELEAAERKAGMTAEDNAFALAKELAAQDASAQDVGDHSDLPPDDSDVFDEYNPGI